MYVIVGMVGTVGTRPCVSFVTVAKRVSRDHRSCRGQGCSAGVLYNRQSRKNNSSNTGSGASSWSDRCKVSTGNCDSMYLIVGMVGTVGICPGVSFGSVASGIS